MCRSRNAKRKSLPDSKVHEANMGPIWGRQDLGGPHVDPINFAIWAVIQNLHELWFIWFWSITLIYVPSKFALNTHKIWIWWNHKDVSRMPDITIIIFYGTIIIFVELDCCFCQMNTHTHESGSGIYVMYELCIQIGAKLFIMLKCCFIVTETSEP